MARTEQRHWVGFDLGGTKMLAVVFDDSMRIVGRARKKTKGQEGKKAGIARMAKTIRAALDDAGLDSSHLAGVGVGCPGPLDLRRGVLLDAPNLGWRDAAIAAALRRELGCPVVLLNDVDAGVFGEFERGAARKARCVVGVFPGTGVGGGCVYEGRLLQGASASCMEIGHLEVEPNGALCGCGRRGCLETVASRLAISAAAAAAAYRGEAPQLREIAGTDLARVRSGALRDAIEAGDEVVEAIVRHAARHLGRAVAGLVNLLAPDVVLLGGGLVEALPRLMRREVKRAANERAMPAFRDSFRVVVARLGDDAAVTGAAAWARRSLEGDGSGRALSRPGPRSPAGR